MTRIKIKNKRSVAKLHPLPRHCGIACEAIVYKWKAKMFHKRLATLIFSWHDFQRDRIISGSCIFDNPSSSRGYGPYIQ